MCSSSIRQHYKRSLLRADIRAFDGFLCLLNPGKIIIGALTSITLYIAYFTNVHFIVPIFPIWVWLMLVAFNLIYITITLSDSSQKINPIHAFLCVIFVNYTYIPLFVWSLFTSGKRVWVRTEHTKSASIADMETQK